MPRVTPRQTWWRLRTGEWRGPLRGTCRAGSSSSPRAGGFTRQDNRKIEAIAVLPGRLSLWDTDDENFDGSVTFERVGR